MNQISAFMKTPLPLPPCHGGHRKKIAVYELGSRLSPDTESARGLILNFLAYRTVRNNFCCLNCPVYVIFVIAARPD